MCCFLSAFPCPALFHFTLFHLTYSVQCIPHLNLANGNCLMTCINAVYCLCFFFCFCWLPCCPNRLHLTLSHSRFISACLSHPRFFYHILSLLSYYSLLFWTRCSLSSNCNKTKSRTCTSLG